MALLLPQVSGYFTKPVSPLPNSWQVRQRLQEKSPRVKSTAESNKRRRIATTKGLY
jgi:hypothetical protein